jgi:WD40 repeat protein
MPDHHHGDELRLRTGTHRLTIYGKGWEAVHEPFEVKAGANEPRRIQLVKQVAPNDKAEEILQIPWPGGGVVYAVALSPDGHYCLASGETDTVKLFDVKTGKEIKEFPGLTAAFKPGGKELVTASRVKGQTMVRVYSAVNWSFLREFGLPDDLWNLRLSPAGDCALVVSPAAYRLVNLETKQTLVVLNCDMNLSTAFFGPDGKQLLLLASGRVPWQVFDCTSVKSPADFAKKNQAPAKAELFKGILNKPKLDGFFPDGKRVFARTQNHIDVVDVNTGKESKRFTIGKEVPEMVQLGPEGKRVLVAYKDHTVRLWDLAGERELCRFSTQLGGVRMLTFSADGRCACAGGSPGMIYVWRLPDVIK